MQKKKCFSQRKVYECVDSFRSGNTSDVDDNHSGHSPTPETVTMLVTLMHSFKNTKKLVLFCWFLNNDEDEESGDKKLYEQQNCFV